MSAAEPGLGPPQPPQPKQPRVLSCVLCQRRKIKCDRTIPCANCIKANVTCTPSKPAPPRHRSRPRKDLQERLSRCEALLKQYSDKPETPLPQPGASMAGAMAEATPGPGTGSGTGTATSSPSMAGTAQSKPPFSPTQTSPASQSSQPPSETSSPSAVRMTTEAGMPRFIDTHMFAVISDEIQAMKSLVEQDDPDGYSLAGGHDPDGEPDHSFPSSNCPSPGDEEKVHLDAVQTFKLWQIYLDRVNPLLKIIHAPTVQPYIVQAAGDITTIPLSYQALLLSIFSLASLSLSHEEMMQIMGVTHEQAVHKFFKDMFYALTRFNFLNRYNMIILQSLVHVLLVQQCLSSGHSAWILCGSLIRMAISMGYHRDGQALKLPPFETEMRRRIWWQIVANDLRLTTDCGLKHYSIPADFDTKIPLNLNDADLFPDASGELQSREGPTEMAFMLVIYRFNQFFMDEDARSTVEQNILGIGNSQNDSNEKSMERNRQLVRKLEEDLTQINQRFINPTAGNNHLAAHGLIPHVIRHLYDMMIPMQEQPEWGTEIQGPRDNVFKMVIMAGEQLEAGYLAMSRWGFSWFMQLYFHIQYLASLTSLLYHRPVGSLADRAWNLIEQMYLHHPELHKLSHRQYAVQAHFVLKAWDVRDQTVTAATGQKPEMPEFLVKLRQIVQPNTPAMSTVSKTTPSTTPSTMPGASVTSAGQQHQQGAFSMPQHLQSPMDMDEQQPQQRFTPVEQMWSTPMHTSLFSLDLWGGGAVYAGADTTGAEGREYASGPFYPNNPSF